MAWCHRGGITYYAREGGDECKNCGMGNGLTEEEARMGCVERVCREDSSTPLRSSLGLVAFDDGIKNHRSESTPLNCAADSNLGGVLCVEEAGQHIVRI